MTKFKKQIQYLSPAELQTKGRDLQELIAKLRLEQAAGKHKNVRGVFNLRKQLAIIKTKLKTP